jgi:site-specific DNA-methyltransferase (adenine-specific)
MVDVTTPTTPAARQWSGWGTALKPAAEHWILVRKPLAGTVAENVQKYGTGALNIDGCRIGTENTQCVKSGGGGTTFHGQEEKPRISGSVSGRFPSNLLLSHTDACQVDACDAGCPVKMMDEQSGILHSRGNINPTTLGGGMYGHATFKGVGFNDHAKDQGASRFFYCAKPARSERNAGLGRREPESVNDGRDTPIDNPFQRGETERLNTHPTVKPVKLMRYLCRLITPPGGTVLDVFAGSGTTGMGALAEGFDFQGCEQNAEYVEIARARLCSGFPKARQQ